MSEMAITVVGNVATDPRLDETKGGEKFASFRLACSSQRYDPRTRTWQDGDTSYYTVYCWRSPFAGNVKESLHKGDPVVVLGRIKNRQWRDRNDALRVTPEVHANAVGHDLMRGTTAFTKVVRPPRPVIDNDEVVDTVRATYESLDEGPNGGLDTVTGEVLGAARPGDDAAMPGAGPRGEPSDRTGTANGEVASDSAARSFAMA